MGKRRQNYLFYTKTEHFASEEYREIPEKGPKKYFYVAREYFWKLVLTSMLGILFCLPVVTIPAALTAVNAVVQQYYRKGYGDVWPVFWEEYRSDFFVRILLFLAVCAVPAAGWLIGGLFGEIPALLAGSLLVTLAICVLCWWFAEMSILTIRPAQALKNAAVLLILEPRASILTAISVMVGAILIFVGWPVTVLLLFFFAPGLVCLAVTGVVNPVLDERIVGKEKASGTEPEGTQES